VLNLPRLTPEHLRVHVDDLHEVLVSSIRAEADVGIVIVGTFAVVVATAVFTK